MKNILQADLFRKIWISIISVIIGLIVACLCIWCIGINPVKAMQTFLSTFSGDLYGISEIFVKALPLMLTGMSYAFASRCGLVNIGAEGQLVMGALFSTLVGVYVKGLPAAVHIPFTILAGFVGGGLLGMIAGLMKTRFGVLEVLSTIMLNYVAQYIVSFMATGPLKEGYLPQSPEFLSTARMPNILPMTRLHAGVLVGLLAILAFYILINRTTFGFRIRAVGDNPHCAHYAGMHVDRNIVWAMFIAGGFAGLAGCLELQGILGRLYEVFSPGWGWDGISVGLLGNSTPIGVLISSLLLGFIRSGVNSMQRSIGVPIGIVYVIQSVIIICILCRDYKPSILKRLVWAKSTKGN